MGEQAQVFTGLQTQYRVFFQDVHLAEFDEMISRSAGAQLSRRAVLVPAEHGYLVKLGTFEHLV